MLCIAATQQLHNDFFLLSRPVSEHIYCSEEVQHSDVWNVAV